MFAGKCLGLIMKECENERMNECWVFVIGNAVISE
jgi:hypothetical protein